MKRALRNIAARLGIKLKKSKEEKGNEVIVTANIWLPYFGGECACVKSTGSEMTFAEFVRAVGARKVSLADLEELAKEKPRTRTNGAAPPETSESAGAEYAALKLADYVAELAVKPEGTRNPTLNDRAFHLGTMIARGWIDRETVEQDIKAAVAHWSEQPKTLGTLKRALDAGMKVPHADLAGKRSRGYEMRADGLYAGTRNGATWVARPFEVLGFACDPSSSNWGRLLRWKDRKGIEHLYVVTDKMLHSDAGALCGDLGNIGLGIGIKNRSLFTNYISQANSERFVTLAERTGWLDTGCSKVFVLPSRTIGNAGDENENVVFTSTHGTPFAVQGTVEQWRDTVCRATIKVRTERQSG